MRILLDVPQPLDQLRKLYNDTVTFITSTTSYPLISEIEVSGDYLSAMRKRVVPVRVGKKLDRLINRYTTKLQRIWDCQHQELIESLRTAQLGKSDWQDDLEKQQEPTLAQVLAETDPSRQQVLLIRYLRARKERLIKPKLDALKSELKRAARPIFKDAYTLGKERGQILTNQETDDEITDEDEQQLAEKEDWNEAYLSGLIDTAYKNYEDVLEEDYETEEEFLDALDKAQQMERHRLPMYAAALGSVLLATGMTQAVKDVQEVDEETGLPTGEPKRDPETGLPLGDAYEGGFWHTMHDERVCEGCEDNDGRWMTLEQFEAEIGTNDCLTNCRCAELFEPAPASDDPDLSWDGIPGIDVGKAEGPGGLEKAGFEDYRHPRNLEGQFEEATTPDDDIKQIREAYGGKFNEAFLQAQAARADELRPFHEGLGKRIAEHLQQVFPDADVKYRIKTRVNMLDKLGRRDDRFKTVDDLNDISGVRVVTKNGVSDVYKIVHFIHSAYPIVKEQDYIKKPQDGYRGYHIDVKDPKTGWVSEIQVRTDRQERWSIWQHNTIYKPMSEKVVDFSRKNMQVLRGYARVMADYYYELDTGRDATRPECPELIRHEDLCLDEYPTVRKRTEEKVIAVDLDGTILERVPSGDPAQFGKPLPGAKEVLGRLQQDGYAIVIHTCRGDRKAVADYLGSVGIPFDHININPDQPGLGFNPGKPLADFYIDDKAIRFRGEWQRVYAEIKERETLKAAISSANDALELIDKRHRAHIDGEKHAAIQHSYQFKPDEARTDWRDDVQRPPR